MERERWQPREAPPAPVSQAGWPESKSTEKLAPLSPSSALTAISTVVRVPVPGARRGRSRGRALRAALSSREGGSPGLTAPALPEVAWRCFRGPRSRRVLCPSFGDLDNLPHPRLSPSRRRPSAGHAHAPPPPARRFRLKIARRSRGGDPGQNGGCRSLRGMRQAARACRREGGRG